MNKYVTPSNKESKNYQGINKELKIRGLKHLKTLFFFSFFTLGFAFFNLYFFGEYNVDTILKVLFNEQLLAYSVITTLGFSGLYVLFSIWSRACCVLSYLAKAFRWVGECCYEFTFGLIVVYLVGFTVEAPISIDSMPWLDLTQFFVYLPFSISVSFLSIALELWLFVDKEEEKKSTCLILVLFFWAVFFVLSLVANWIS